MEIFIIFFALLSTLLQLIAIMKGRVIAPRVSWLIWFILGIACLIVNYGFNKWDSTSKMLASLSIGNLGIVIYILLKNRSGWTMKETILLSITILIVVLWVPFKIYSERQALLWATIISQILLHGAHFIGVWNHWKKVWVDPFTEAEESWVCRLLSATLALIVSILQQQSIAVLISPVYAIITTMTLLLLIYRRRYQLRHYA